MICHALRFCESYLIVVVVRSVVLIFRVGIGLVFVIAVVFVVIFHLVAVGVFEFISDVSHRDGTVNGIVPTKQFSVAVNGH